MPASDFYRNLRSKVGHDLVEMPVAGCFVFNDDRQLLLIRHSEGHWSNPGGVVEPFESPADAAVRETWEETGLLVEPTRILGVFGGADYHIKYPNGDEVTYVSTAFEAKVVSGRLKVDGQEAIDAGWFAEEEALALSVRPQLRRVLEIAFTSSQSPHFDPPTWTPPTRA